MSRVSGTKANLNVWVPSELHAEVRELAQLLRPKLGDGIAAVLEAGVATLRAQHGLRLRKLAEMRNARVCALVGVADNNDSSTE